MSARPVEVAVVELLRRTRVERGLPARVADPVVLRNVARILGGDR